MIIKQKKWTVLQFIYAILLGGLLLGYLLIQAFDHEPFSYPVWLAFLRVLVAVLGIWLGKLWKDKGFQIIILLYLLQIVRIAFKDSWLFFTDSVSDNFINGIWAIAGCYSLGRVLSLHQLKTFLHIVFTSWIIGIVIQCLISLYGAFTDQGFTNLYGVSIWEGGSIWGIIWEERLTVGFLYPTVTGSYLGFSAMAAAYSTITEKKKALKIVNGFAFAIIIFALGLTDSRASYVSAAAGFGIIAFLLVLKAIKDKERNKKEKEIRIAKDKKKVWCIAAICMAFVFIFSLLAIFSVAPVFNRMKAKGASVISVAKADEAIKKTQQVISRGVSGQDVLSGRFTVWKGTVSYIFEKPLRLLFGVSVYNPMAGPNQKMGTQMAHCHNIVIQILLESGITGVILALSFVLYTLKNFFQIIQKEGTPIWILILPALFISILVGDMAECFTWFRSWNSVALAFLFVTAGIINTSRDQRVINVEESLA